MARDTTHVRLKWTTMDRLEAMRQGILGAADVGGVGTWWESDKGPTVDELLNRLLDARDGHRTRASDSRRVRRAERRAALLAAGWVPAHDSVGSLSK